MKNLKKFLAVIIAVCMLASFMVPAFAADEDFSNYEKAVKLYEMGIISGTSTTEMELDMENELDREEAITLITIMMGAKAEVEALSNEDIAAALAIFDDADEISSWAQPYVAYAATEFKVVGNGVSFQPKTPFTGKMFAALLLNCMGIEYEYATATAALAAVNGMTTADAVAYAEKGLDKNDVYGLTFNALTAEYTDGATIIENLALLGAVNEDKAIEYGFLNYPEELVEAITVEVANGATDDEIIAALPAEVDVVWTNGDVVTYSVEWDVSDVDSKVAGTYVAAGYVADIDADITADVTVGDVEFAATATATAANEITVEFTKAADPEATTISVKLGFVPQDVTVEYADDNMSATLTAEDNFVAGDYTVVVDDMEIALKISAQKMVSFTITTNALTAESATQAVKYAAVDQYGNVFDYAATNFTATAYNVTDGAPISINGSGNEFAISALSGNKDDKVLVTLVHKTDGVSQSVTYTVEAKTAVAAIELGTPAPKADTARIYKNDSSDDLILPITFKDQYGKVITPVTTLWSNPGDVTLEEVMFISSNNNIVDPANFSVNADDKVTYQTGTQSGTVTITAIAKKSGNTTSVTFEVFNSASLASVQLQQPSGLIVADEDVTVTYVGKDTYGSDKKLENVSDLVWFSTDPTIVDPTADISVDSKGVLKVTPVKAGTVTISAFLGGVKQGEITLTVKAEAVATKITKLADGTITYFSSNAGTKTYAKADVVFVDQYNRIIKSDAASLDGTITVAVKDSSTGVVTATGSTVTAVATGTKTITLTYTDSNDSGTEDDIVLTKDFTVTVINENAVVDYKVTDIANTKLRSASYANSTAAGDFARQFVVEHGLDANGNKVALSAADADDILLTTSSVEVGVDSVNNKVYAMGTSNDKTAVVAAWKKGVKIAEVTFTTSNAAPAVASFKFGAESYTISVSGTVDMATKITSVKDQYGVTIANPSGTYFTADTSIATVNASTGVVTGVKAGETTVTFVTATGLNASAKIVVE